MGIFRKLECKFFTATILEWKYLLTNDFYKEVIVNSLSFLVADNRVYVHAFVIMNNHIHILWSIRSPNTQNDVQHHFLSYTAHVIIKHLKANNDPFLTGFKVNTSDRKFQVWERNPLTVDLWDEAALIPKLHYIHNNPVKGGLCNDPMEYKYSSAKFYKTGEDTFGFLSHYL